MACRPADREERPRACTAAGARLQGCLPLLLASPGALLALQVCLGSGMCPATPAEGALPDVLATGRIYEQHNSFGK